MYDKLKNDILTADFSDDEENPGEIRLSTDNPARVACNIVAIGRILLLVPVLIVNVLQA